MKQKKNIMKNKKKISADTLTLCSIINLREFIRPICAAIVIGGGFPKLTSTPDSIKA